ncbi:TatD family hydrolase [Testudinibacter sp. TR-2022]|uniref:TatD family hydrolase n=1 Tax=Testudinibacter sp. TR-2022 TaxID=2585029 RepID=UPI001118FED8|nr:TatD family hydrolase [Testudinibacter sp. TR-2022]TNH07640.1 TatD family deoxyribonuclease [Pasteurellaceae bacterium Phil11]TNH20977.1 TatD family deoxyribonuclease [Testudinibacter sp. TR-2022]TNH25561.1 TatD family deoxyribonuclease [Testudinibacter sp. TR-2022]
MPFFDTHTHFDYLIQQLQQPVSEAVAEASAVGVEKILIAAVVAEQFDSLTALCEQAPAQLCYGLGLHPLYIRQHEEQDLTQLKVRLNAKPHLCKAVAEIGLERAVEELITPEIWQKQCHFLETQLYLARDFNLPVSLHSRRSHDQLYPFLKRIFLPKKGVVHGFAGSYHQAKRFVDLGYFIGVGGTISYPRANKTREAIRQLPLDSLVLETDSPDMPLLGFQGQPNRPERLPLVLQALSELRSEPTAQIQETTWRNSRTLFDF